jgi:hypothetical protein
VKRQLITGRRVALSEDIEIIRHIKGKLDAFITTLKDEQAKAK